jgi:hypothetical protein
LKKRNFVENFRRFDGIHLVVDGVNMNWL